MTPAAPYARPLLVARLHVDLVRQSSALCRSRTN
ncbi:MULTISPECIES: putative leader peptide [unclassified Streptomyces]|nr:MULTISPECIES: putative leader peptide [unclassified Streptomyces]